MTMVKTLVALATERMLLKTSGPTFLRGIEFMYAAGLAPDRLSVMMTSSHKYVLQFHSKCDIRPFAANYPNFGRVLRGIVHVREWRIKSIEFVNVAFYMRDVDNLERAIEKLGVELVLLRNCTYPGVQRGEEAVKFLSALNRKKQAVVCEYGDDRLKHRIGRRTSGNRARRASRNGVEVVAPPQDAAEVVAAPAAAQRDPDVGIAPAIRPPAPQALDPIPEAPAALNNEPVPMMIQQQPAPVQRAPPPQQQQAVRRPIPVMPQQIIIPQQALPNVAPIPQAQQQHQIAPAPAADGANLQNALPGRASSGRVVVGAHVYEFRAVDVPNADNIPAVQNLNHLLNVLNDNQQHDLRVIVLPQDARPGQAIQLNNNNNMLYRRDPNLPVNNELQFRAAAAVAAVGGALPAQEPAGIAPPPMQQVPPMRNQPRLHQPLPHRRNYVPPMHNNMHMQQYDHQGMPIGYQAYYPAQPMPQQQPQWNNGQHPQANMPQVIPRALFVPYPMFGHEGNEPLVQRAGDESNDSTDREDQQEMYDPEQQRNEALRDLVADAEAQPNFAPVEAQPDDLEELEQEAEGEAEQDGEDDDEMEEGGSVEGQFMIVDQPEPVQ